MTILTFRGDQIAEALQFDDNNRTTTVEIGRSWFAATDTVEINFTPGSFNASTGELIGGAGAVIGFKVTTATGQVTTFGVSSRNALDIDPDDSKNGAGFFYISETPSPGIGGAYAGLQPEKMVVSSTTLIAGSSPIFNNLGGFIPDSSSGGGSGEAGGETGGGGAPPQQGSTTLTFRGDQIAEALQFDDNNRTTTVEIGRSWFAATDTVEINFTPGSFNASTGELIGGAGAVIGFKVTTATGQVTTFGVSSRNALDIDPDDSKNGAGFFYISETPSPGIGGAYAGLQPEKMVVSSTTLIAGSSPIFNNLGGFIPTNSSIEPINPQQLAPTTSTINGSSSVDRITGTNQSELISTFAGADIINSKAGNDVILSGDGNDVVNAGPGNDLIHGGDGDDRLKGGAGSDRFVFGAGDTVLDFKQSQGDKIIIDANKVVNITFGNGSAFLSLQGESGSMTIRKVNPLTFNADIALEYGNINELLNHAML